MSVKNVLIGPFLGDFRSEIIDFRPFTRWVYEILKPEKMYIATHSNRAFLYDWATVIPVFEDLSRDELNQNGFIHNSVSQKDLILVIKKIKSDVNKQISEDKDFLYLQSPYTKSVHWIPLYKKIYSNVSVNKKKKKKTNILYIPCISEKYATVRTMYEHLVEKYGDNVVVAGDMKIHLHENNVMLRNTTYFKDIYCDMLEMITNAKVVITPNSHWTILSLMQHTPVFSWGSMAQHYNNDTKQMVLHQSIPIDNMKLMMETFINSIK
jgi:hypothetical protein